MWRILLIIMQLTATGLFLAGFQGSNPVGPLAWIPPFILIALVLVNSFWFSRFVSWIIFSAAFSAFLILLSAFTLRWRLESAFDPWPFYRSIVMYIAFVYVSLAQIKIMGRKLAENETPPEENNAKV